MKAIAYYRVSSEQQRQKQSIELQKIRLNKHSIEKNYEVVAEFQDDGISGEGIDSRPGFLNALDMIKQDEIDVFLVYMIDRIGRFKNRKDRNRVIELLEESHTSVDSPYDDFFRYDNEDDLNDLEKLLNESRRDNVKRGIRISEGHMANRLNGKFSGGQVPYGLCYIDRIGFQIVQSELDTLKEIFKKISTGWGLNRTRDFLNLYLDRFPKRARKYKGKPVKEWSAIHIRGLVHNDFYYTGIIQLTPDSEKKGVQAIDTKIKLFDQDSIEIARREVSIKRARYFDPNLINRKHSHAQQDETVFTDALLHGLIRCGHCGWKLGLQKQRFNGRVYYYYKCRGVDKGKCDFKQVSGLKLDKLIWRKFIETLQEPAKVQEQILKQEFLFDKDRKAQISLFESTKKDLKKLAKVKARILKQFRWGHLNDDEYRAEMEKITKLYEQTEKNLNRYREAVERPIEVEETVKRATQLIAEQANLIWTLNQIREIDKDIEAMENDIDQDDIEGKILIAKCKESVIDETNQIIKDLLSKLTISPADRNNDIKALIFQQKRMMLQRFINHEENQGIRINSLEDVEINFLIKSLRRSKGNSSLLPVGICVCILYIDLLL